MKIITVLLTIVLLSCDNGPKKKLQRKNFNDKIIESYFINDSLPDGISKYYDLNGRLESVITFSKGLKNGIAINYYYNGKTHDSSFYQMGKKNGEHFVFDSAGKLIYEDYYFHGQQLGGQIFYRNGNPFQYVFNTFEKKIIYSCEYDSIGMSAFSGEIINANIFSSSIDGKKGYGVFAYLLNPPKIQIKYSLGIIDVQNHEKKLVSFDNKRIFVDTILNAAPNGWKYFMSAEYVDTLNNLNKVYIHTLEF